MRRRRVADVVPGLLGDRRAEAAYAQCCGDTLVKGGRSVARAKRLEAIGAILRECPMGPLALAARFGISRARVYDDLRILRIRQGIVLMRVWKVKIET